MSKMSHSWSSFTDDKLIMESWRRYLTKEESDILTEEQLEELFGKREWEKLVDKFAKEDADYADAAVNAGLTWADVTDASGNALDIKVVEAKLLQFLRSAAKNKDPELEDAVQDLAQNVDQVTQGETPEEAIADDDVGTPDEKEPPLPSLFRPDRAMLTAVLKDPGGNFGQPTRFRNHLHKYLRQTGELPGNINLNSPLIRAIVNVVHSSLMAMGHKVSGQSQPADAVTEVFLPIILEEVKKEKKRRAKLKQTNRV